MDVAQHLASLIGGVVTDGQAFADTSRTTPGMPTGTRPSRFEDPASPAPTLFALIVITSRASASASELVINGLRPFMPVVLIGDATYGKPVGQYLIGSATRSWRRSRSR